MFDQAPAPNNLPFEPEVKTPAPAPSARPAPMKNGIMSASQHEPEDILAGAAAEPSEVSEQDDAAFYEEPASGGDKRMKMIMIILASVAGVFILIVGGLFAYQKF